MNHFVTFVILLYVYTLAKFHDYLHVSYDMSFSTCALGDKMLYDVMYKRFTDELKSLGTARVNKEVQFLRAVSIIKYILKRWANETFLEMGSKRKVRLNWKFGHKNFIGSSLHNTCT